MRFNAFLAKLPSTNYVIFVAVLLASVVILTILTLLVLNRPVNQGVLDSLLKTVAGLATIATAQFTAKRATFKGDPPNAPDVEDRANA